jgi:hypothetical protein
LNNIAISKSRRAKWGWQIDVALQEADILLVIFTDRMKIVIPTQVTKLVISMVHSATPEGSAGFDQIYIPFASELMYPHDARYPGRIHRRDRSQSSQNEDRERVRTCRRRDHPVFKLLASLGSRHADAWDEWSRANPRRQTSICIISNYSRIFAR